MSHSYYHDHTHTQPFTNLRSASSPQRYGAIVGTINQDTEHEITGRSGEHLQFYVEIGNNVRYQVDVNTQSKNGTPVQVYFADQGLEAKGVNPDEPFGAPAYGAFPDAALSYQSLGLTDANFADISDTRIEAQLEAALNAAEFVAIYGMIFDDGGDDAKGIHETHYTGIPNQDGAVCVYSTDASNQPKRTWFFFKFQEDRIPTA